jgi:hypothetical protein
MPEIDALVDDLTNRYPHLVLELSGPWRDEHDLVSDSPWISNFKNRSRLLQYVHPGSSGSTMLHALKAGLEYLDGHADEPAVRNHDSTVEPVPTPR